MKLLEPKYRRLMRALAIPAILIFVLSVIAMVTGRMALSYEGIAADDAGRLYLGRGGKIEVYEAGQKVSAITPHVDKSFLFTVRDGQLLLSTGKTVVTLDLQGNEVEQQADEDGALYKELKAQRRSFTAADGTVYTLRHEMLAAQVVTDSGSVVFSEPGWANVLKPLLALAGLYVIFAAGSLCHAGGHRPSGSGVKNGRFFCRHVLTKTYLCAMMTLQSKGCWCKPAEIQRIAAVIPRT